MKKLNCYDCDSFTSCVEEGDDCLNSSKEAEEVIDSGRFPSSELEKCFSINFWSSKFAEIVCPDMDSEHDKKVWLLFSKTDNLGNLPTELEQEFETLKKAYNERHETA